MIKLGEAKQFISQVLDELLTHELTKKEAMKYLLKLVEDTKKEYRKE